MVYKITTKIVIQGGNSLTMEFGVFRDNSNQWAESTSDEFIINGVVVFQILIKESAQFILYFIRFTKKQNIESLSYTVTYTHWENIYGTSMIQKCYSTDDDTWHFIGKVDPNVYKSISLEVNMTKFATPYASLHEDTELTDFKLCAEDGFVNLHKAVAASFSPVFKTMFAGEWKESSEASVDLPHTSKATLQHLKDYMYLGTLPKTGLKELLLLSSYYMLTDLQLRCINGLRCKLTPENANEFIEFAVKHKMMRLLLDILDCVQKGSLDVDEIRKYEKLMC